LNELLPIFFLSKEAKITFFSVSRTSHIFFALFNSSANAENAFSEFFSFFCDSDLLQDEEEGFHA